MNQDWIPSRTAPRLHHLDPWVEQDQRVSITTRCSIAINFTALVSLSTLISFSLGLTMPTLAQTQSESSSSTLTISTPTIARPTLRLGSQGERVTELQSLLKLWGFYQGEVDGNFQDSTAIAVVSFQQAAGLTTDGIVGANTWNHLLPTAAAVSSNLASPTPVAPTPAPSPAPPPTPSPTPAPSPTASPAPTPSRTPSPTASPTPTPRPATTSASAADSVSLPTLRLGMRGPAVTRLQQRLRAIGVFNGEIDGIFGFATQTAVQSAQRRYNLTPDGVVGNATWGALLR